MSYYSGNPQSHFIRDMCDICIENYESLPQTIFEILWHDNFTGLITL